MSDLKSSVADTNDFVDQEAVLHPTASDEEEVIKRLGQLLGEGAVEEARALAREAQQRWPDSPQVQKWAYVLEPAKARVVPGPPAPPWDKERAWLRQHAHEYPGQWVALLGDQLIAADADLSKVLDAVKQTGRESEALLHFQPEKLWSL
jgi:hypothetical protein